MRLRPGTQDAATLGEVRAYRQLELGTEDVVLDLGGCIGAFGRECVEAGVRSIVALEPEPSNADLYRENVPEALVLTQAVAADAGWDELWFGQTNSHALGRRRGRTDFALVETVTLPALLSQHRPTIVKADIEGAEYLLDWSGLQGVRGVAIELHFSPKRAWRQEARRVCQEIEAQGFEQVRPFRDTGKNWHCVTVWRRDA